MSRHSTLGSLSAIIFLVAGCGDDGPTVAADVPQVKITPEADLSRGRPKGMPKNITAGLKLDPVSGRPKQD